jgi:hypothetical protein
MTGGKGRGLPDKRGVSQPLSDMLKMSNLEPKEVEAAIDHIKRKHRYPVLRGDHEYVQRVRKATGIHLTTIALRYGRLLSSIDHVVSRRDRWTYNEVNGRRCVFRCTAMLPSNLQPALPGRLLGTVVVGIDPLGAVEIIGLEEQTPEGWLGLMLKPSWIPF